MSINQPTEIIERPFSPVNPDLNTEPNSPPVSMAHHNSYLSLRNKVIVSYSNVEEGTYGVSSNYRVLTKGLLQKRTSYIIDCLRVKLGLTPGQIEIVMRLLRLWVYYGAVFPSEAHITEDGETNEDREYYCATYALPHPPRARGCSKATFWRTIRTLRELGLVSVVNRYVLRPHAQISNLYRLDRLLVVLAKYLADHIHHTWPDWIERLIMKPWPLLWESFLPEADISSRSLRSRPTL